MFSKNLLSFTRTISFRLTVWYSFILMASATVLFVVTYFLLYTSLKNHDKEAITSRLDELATVYQTGGLPLLEKNIRISKKLGKHFGFLIRLADAQNRTILIELPYQWTEFNLKQLEQAPPSHQRSFFRIYAQGEEDFLAIESLHLADGCWLQVGKTTHERNMTLEHFREVLSTVIIPLILLGFAGGAFLSYRALIPIRSLISTVRSISTNLGKIGTRVPNTGSNDELEELVTLFNTMLEKIEDLITAMKNSLDHVAHDLKTPMTRLRGIAEIALQATSSVDHCKSALADCMEESERILKLVDTLLDISEAETGVMHLDLRHTDLAELIEQVVDLYTYVAETKSITIRVYVEKNLWAKIDRTRIGQVLANIVDNAVKYTPKGGTVSLRASKGEDKIIIEISDTGMGIAEHELPRIWDRLYRGDKSRSQKGLGLGLTFVRAIVKLHNGEIEVSSHIGKGSTFTIYLPYYPQNSDISKM